jgi:hypothetical protein
LLWATGTVWGCAQHVKNLLGRVVAVLGDNALLGVASCFLLVLCDRAAALLTCMQSAWVSCTLWWEERRHTLPYMYSWERLVYFSTTLTALSESTVCTG